MTDPVTRTRRMLREEIEMLRLELSSVSDPEEAAEVAAELDRAEGSLASLDMCFL